jgi:hypothetical protein
MAYEDKESEQTYRKLWMARPLRNYIAGNSEKEIAVMKYFASVALFLVLCASLAGCAAQRDHIIYQRHAGYNYCHTKVETAGNPLMPNERDIVDYYGPCDAFD